MAGRIEFNSGKFKELVLLLAYRSKDDPLMSRVKLNKLLYRCDFEAFRLLGRSMTGASYVVGEFGPMAAELPGAEIELGRKGYLEWDLRDEGAANPRKVPIAIETPDESLFIPEEIEIVAAALAHLSGYGGRAASDWSHEESAGWRLKQTGDDITYESGLIETQPLSDEQEALLRDYVAGLPA